MLVQPFHIRNPTVLGSSNIPQYIMVLNHGSSDVPYDHDDLIYFTSPTPNSFVMRVVTLDEWVVGVALADKVPLVDSRPTSECFHLNERHAFVARWEAGNKRLEEINIIWDLIFRRLPFTGSTAEINTEATLCR